MERLRHNFSSKNGVLLRLPPGFRFHPTDEELVVQYLKRKVQSHPLPSSIVTEVDVGKLDPWDLPGEPAQERYFFTARETTKYSNGNRSNRATGSGYWKATGSDKEIVKVGNRRQVVVGMKKTLVFYRGKPPKGARTDWIMHEYRLNNSSTPTPSINNNNNAQLQQEDWVLCRIFLKKRAATAAASKNNGYGDESGKAVKSGLVFYDFMAKERDGLSRGVVHQENSSYSCSSGVTEISLSYKSGGTSDCDNREESSFSCNNSVN